MSPLRARPASLVVAFCLFFGALSFAQTPAPVTGRVIAEETDQPVVDARVEIEGTPHLAMADASGAFTLPAVPPGRYTLVVGREGFETVRAQVEVIAGDGRPIEVRLPFALALQEAVTVIGRTVGDLGLAGQASTASRLNLRPIDIPASVDILNSSVMDARGYQRSATRWAAWQASCPASIPRRRPRSRCAASRRPRWRRCGTASGWGRARW